MQVNVDSLQHPTSHIFTAIIVIRRSPRSDCIHQIRTTVKPERSVFRRCQSHLILPTCALGSWRTVITQFWLRPPISTWSLVAIFPASAF